MLRADRLLNLVTRLVHHIIDLDLELFIMNVVVPPLRCQVRDKTPSKLHLFGPAFLSLEGEGLRGTSEPNPMYVRADSQGSKVI